jgi:hypothetical protein
MYGTAPQPHAATTCKTTRPMSASSVEGPTLQAAKVRVTAEAVMSWLHGLAAGTSWTPVRAREIPIQS